MDPFDLPNTSKSQNVFSWKDTEGQTSIGGYDIPRGVTHSSPLTSGYVSETQVVSSSFELQSSSKRDVSVDVGLPGVFEFSASNSVSEMQSITSTRKWSYGYSKAYRELHIVQVDLLNPKPELTLTTAFLNAVAALPVGDDDSESVMAKYTNFIREFGTHFTTNVTLGGFAYQRTRGTTSRYLQSRESEEDFKIKASAVIKEVSAGVSVDNASKSSTSTDQSDDLERDEVKFIGGIGSVTGITDEWLASLETQPAITKANLEELSELFDPKFFPNDAQIEDKAALLDLAVVGWIYQYGKHSTGTAPLRYGEKLILALPWLDGTTVQYPVLTSEPPVLTYPVSNGKPHYGAQRSAAIVLENVDPARAGTPILSGDNFRVKLVDNNKYAGPKPNLGLTFGNVMGDASIFTIRNESENIEGRSNQFFTEGDKLRIMFPSYTAGVGISHFITIDASDRQTIASDTFDNLVKFNLLRAEWLK